MATNYASLAFTDQVKVLQEKYGSRASYDRMEKRQVIDGLSENEVHFIRERDSFYMATIGENGFPYIQHRGGPKGFLKVIDRNTIGFIDFSGNKQYISVGNLATNKNTSLILMDYAAQARLKIYARTEVVALNAKTEWANLFTLENYAAKPERILVLHIEAYDWNCPQHITPRYTVEEVEEALEPQRAYIRQLEEELKKRSA